MNRIKILIIDSNKDLAQQIEQYCDKIAQVEYFSYYKKIQPMCDFCILSYAALQNDDIVNIITDIRSNNPNASIHLLDFADKELTIKQVVHFDINGCINNGNIQEFIKEVSKLHRRRLLLNKASEKLDNLKKKMLLISN